MKFDSVCFGFIVAKTAKTGLFTPPLGLNAEVSAGRTPARLQEFFKGLIPFIVIGVSILCILIAFPEITLFLPDLMNQ